MGPVSLVEVGSIGRYAAQWIKSAIFV